MAKWKTQDTMALPCRRFLSPSGSPQAHKFTVMEEPSLSFGDCIYHARQRAYEEETQRQQQTREECTSD